MAPICGTPAASRTVPEIADLSEAADIVERADNASTINSHRYRFVFIPTTFAVPSVAVRESAAINSDIGPRSLTLPSTSQRSQVPRRGGLRVPLHWTMNLAVGAIV